VLAGAAVAVLLAHAFYRRKREVVSANGLRLLAGLRAFAVAVIALFLLQPVLRLARAESARSMVAVMVDASESMSIKDAANDRSRFDGALDLLRGEPQRLLDRLAQVHRVRVFTFGAAVGEMGNARDLASVRPDQKATAIGEALRQVARQTQEDNLAGIVLLTDGVSNLGDEPGLVARTLGVPVFPVVLGGRAAERGRFYDVGIGRVPQRPQYIVNNRATVQVELTHRGLAKFLPAERELPLRLLEVDGEPAELASTTVSLPAEDGSVQAELEFVPRRLGVHRLRVTLPALPDETVTENNSRSFTALVTDPRIRVLMVEGVVRSEYRFLRRVLESDPNLEVTSVVKLSGRQFLVQGVQPAVDLSRGLPARPEDFGKFDVVVLGDVGCEEFAGVQLEYLKAFVEAGGGLLALGGYHSFGAGGYADSPLADALPLIMAGRTDGHVEGTFVPVLTAEGKAHPIFGGCEPFFSDATGRASLDGVNRVTGAKPGAQVLAVHPAERAGDRPMPVVAVQQYGAGPVMAMTADTTWKWKFQVEAQGMDSPYYRFWRQSIRWLAGRKGPELISDRPLVAWASQLEYQRGEPAVLKARVLSRQMEPFDRATVEASIAYPIPVKARAADGQETTETSAKVRLDSVPLSPGDYQALWRPPAGGLYHATASAADEQGELGTDAFEFVIGEAASEFDRVDADEAGLRSLAAQTGGTSYSLATAGRMPQELRQRRSTVVRRQEVNLSNSPWLFTFLVACLTAEWILRKRRGLN
jgi:uncharacterized membrane protein